MVETVLNLMFGCRHRRLTRPITPAHRPGTEARSAYVACLECGKRFHYDVHNMLMGRPVEATGPNSAGDSNQSR
jgi:hypothetical protein